MGKRQPTEAEIAAIIAGKPKPAFCREFDCGGSYFNRLRAEHRAVPAGIDSPNLAPALHIAPGAFIIAGDWHIPHHDPVVVRRLLSVAQKQRIDSLIINGDFLDESVFFKGGSAHRPTMVDFRLEVDTASQMMSMLRDRFERIIWVPGNHEQRLYRLSRGEIDAELLRRLVAEGSGSQIVTTDRDYAIVQYGSAARDTWRITHGQGGSVVTATSAAVHKAMIYNCNVVQGHNHLWGMSQTPNGLFLGVDHGCVADPARIAYKQLSTTTHSQWVQGFAVLRDSRVRLYSPTFGDW